MYHLFNQEVLPARSAPTFIELLIKAMLTQNRGFFACGLPGRCRAAGSIISMATRPIVPIMSGEMLGEPGPIGDQVEKALCSPLALPVDAHRGNTGKLDAAKILLRRVAIVFTCKKVCLLLDSWYMKATLSWPLVFRRPARFAGLRRCTCFPWPPAKQ